MSKRKWIYLTTIPICLVCLLIWLYHFKIIDGNYDKLTITKMGETMAVIENKEEIDRIIDQINQSSRMFQPKFSGFRYDYMPYGILIFENDQEKVKIGFVLPKGNVLTQYWEIETNFDFSRDVN
jgi:hypothetical protein